MEPTRLVRAIPIIRHPRDGKAAVSQSRDRRLLRTECVVFVNLDLTTNLASITLKDLGSNVVVGTIIPSSNKVAVRKRHHGNIVLGTARRRVKLELITRHNDRSITISITGCEDLTEDTPTTGVRSRTVGMSCLVTPSNNKITTGKSRYIWIVLVAACVGVGRKIIANRISIGIITLATDTVARGVFTILRGVILPGDDEAAVIHGRHRRIRLIIRRIAVDLELGTGSRTVGIITLSINTVVAASRILITRMPGDDKAAVGKAGDGWIVLSVIGLAVD